MKLCCFVCVSIQSYCCVSQGFLLDGLSTAELHELLAMIVHAATLLQRPESTCLTIVSRVVETLSKCCAIAQSAPLTSHLHRIIQQLETINIQYVIYLFLSIFTSVRLNFSMSSSWFEVLMSTNVLPVLHQAALHLFCSLCLYSPIFHRRSVKLFGFIAHLLSQSVSVNVLAILISTLCGAPVLNF
jgi:hypothetical protein